MLASADSANLLEHYRSRVRELEEENERLQDRLEIIEGELSAPLPLLPELQLTPSERVVLGVFVARPLATKNALMAALYSGRAVEHEPDIKIVDIYVHKLRRRLKQIGVVIVTHWGLGWSISPVWRERLRAGDFPAVAAPAVNEKRGPTMLNGIRIVVRRRAA